MTFRLSHSTLLLITLFAPLLAEEHLKFGQPQCAEPLLDKKFFVVCYDRAHRLPAWVGYALTKGDATKKATARIGSFRADPSLQKGQRAESADYAGKGYDIGHMAAANDFTRSVEAMKSTFVLTNAVPQTPGLNRGRWKQLEAAVHKHAAAHGTAWIYSGPVFAGGKPTKTIGRDKVAIPTHTYKVVLCVHPDGVKEMFGFVLPNVTKPTGAIDSYSVSVNQVEKLTGLDFFSALPADEQTRLERATKMIPID